MSRATVEDEIIQEAGEEGNNSGSHIEPNVIINPGGESGCAPAGAESPGLLLVSPGREADIASQNRSQRRRSSSWLRR